MTCFLGILDEWFTSLSHIDLSCLHFYFILASWFTFLTYSLGVLYKVSLHFCLFKTIWFIFIKYFRYWFMSLSFLELFVNLHL